MIRLNTFSLLFFSFVAMTGSETVLAPKVQISFPDVGDKDFANDTLAIMTNSNPVFELLCSASYPIEWIFHYGPEDDGTSEHNKFSETRRITKNFTDLSSYKFSAKLRLEYKGKLLSLANFTCQRVPSGPLASHSDTDEAGRFRTHVVMKERNQKSLIILEIVYGNLRTEIVSSGIGRNIDSRRRENCDRAVAKMAKMPEYLEPCWVCADGKSGSELELDFEVCLTPTECSSTYARHNKGKNCLVSMPNVTRTCKFNNGPNLNPKIVLCKHFGPALAQFYFLGVFQGVDIMDESIPAPPTYFDWSEADPSSMLFIHPIHRSVLYLGEQVEFTCQYSRYYFSLGSWIGFRSKSGMKYVKPVDLKPCDHDAEKIERSRNNCTIDDSWRGTYSAKWNTSFEETGPHNVFCFGPVWNSTEWVNTSLSFKVEKGEAPKVVSVEPVEKTDFATGQQKRKLVCRFSGKPVPVVTWSGPSNETNFRAFKVNDTASKLSIPEIGIQTTGKYSCSVSSYLGRDSKDFDLKPKDTGKLSTGAIIGISVSVLVVATAIILLILRMRRIIEWQREALRLLTEAEIQEFVEGNPQLLEQAKHDCFDKSEVIEALPYDQKYEIPVNNLSIDYSNVLGSGEFGVVVKGKICASNAPNYVRISEATNSYVTLPLHLEVAVKICKGNLDVTNFKALLTEIKVMAYLGSHDNIVNLIGASTENIKNRELYIAVEYCRNGSLDFYLRKNKGHYENKLVDGSNEGIRGHITLWNLYKWTSDISQGLQYIHSKKIIHADLAIRNVLLTKDLSAKIGDFGLSRQLVESSTYTKTTKSALPWRNMAVESLRNLEFSVKSDMWSFGITLWELFTLGDVPYPGLTYTVDFVSLLEQGLRLYKPPFASNAIYDYMLLCWNCEPCDRPETGDAIAICANILNQRT